MVTVAVEEAIKMLHLLKKIFLAVLMVIVSTASSLTAWAGEKDIVILYTNDIHCAIEDNEGLAGLVKLKKDTFAKTPYVALVDAGDAIQGSPIGSLSRGEVFTRLMNNVGYDFAIPGNHEFDYGMERFLELAKKLDCGYYSSNFVDSTGKNVLPASKVITFGKTKVGFVGVTTPSTLTSSTPKYFQDNNGNYIYSFCEDTTGQRLYKQVQKAVDAVRAQKVDYVIVVAHLGMSDVENRWSSTALAQNVAGIDAIIDGHSHEVNPATLVEGKDNKCVLITQTGTKLKNIGQLTIGANGQITSKLVNGLVEKDAAMENAIAKEKAAFEEILKQPLGEALVPLYVNDPETGKRLVRTQEVNMGNLVADAFKEVLNADVALVNGGGIRKDILQGVFTYKDILEVLPFNNMATMKEVSGQQILDALEMGVRKLPEESGGFFKSQLLIKRTSCFIAIAAGFFDHAQNSCIRSRDGGCPLTNIHAFGADAFAVQIIRPCGTALHSNTDNRNLVHYFIPALNKHRNIRAHSIPDGVGNSQHHVIYVVNTAYAAIVIHTNIESTAIAIGEGNDGILDVINILSLQFGRFVFCKHKHPPRRF